MSNSNVEKFKNPKKIKNKNEKKLEEFPLSSDEADPALLEAPYGSCLILGKSGTGKTTLLKNITDLQLKRREVKKLFVLNDRDHQHSRGKSISALADLRLLPKHCMVILEDVISLKKKEEEFVRQLLNYDCHHKQIFAYVVAHHVYRTSLLGMLPFFHYIIFTSHRSNVPLIKISLTHFHLDKSELDKIVNYVQANAEGSSGESYFVFDCRHMDFYKAPSFEAFMPESRADLQLVAGNSTRASSLESSATHTGQSFGSELQSRGRRESEVSRLSSPSEISEKMLEKFKFFSASLDKPVEAQFLLRMILSCLPSELVREHDLTFNFQRKNGFSDKVSIVDYVVSLLDESSPPVTKELLFFHRYLSKHCCVPAFFQKNKNYKK